MRKYKSTFKVKSDDVQGEGSFVIFKRLSWAEMRPLLDLKSDERAEKIVRACTLDWNWTDDNDQPLPNPQSHPEIFDALMSEELAWLMANVNGEATVDEAKN